MYYVVLSLKDCDAGFCAAPACVVLPRCVVLCGAVLCHAVLCCASSSCPVVSDWVVLCHIALRSSMSCSLLSVYISDVLGQSVTSPHRWGYICIGASESSWSEPAQ